MRASRVITSSRRRSRRLERANDARHERLVRGEALMTAFGSCRGAGPLPRDVEQRGKNRRRFHTSPRIRVGGVERVDRSGAHARSGSARRIGRRSLAPAIQGRPPGVRTTRAGSIVARARLKPRIGRVPGRRRRRGSPVASTGVPGRRDAKRSHCRWFRGAGALRATG